MVLNVRFYGSMGPVTHGTDEITVRSEIWLPVIRFQFFCELLPQMPGCHPLIIVHQLRELYLRFRFEQDMDMVTVCIDLMNLTFPVLLHDNTYLQLMIDIVYYTYHGSQDFGEGGDGMATVSYGLKVTNAYHVFDATLRIYRAAVRYLMDIADLHYRDLLECIGYISSKGRKVTAQQHRQQYMERLVHSTEKHPAVYRKFDRDFYKFPSYLRRDAINTAVGNILSYHSQLKRWEDGGRQGRRPFLKRKPLAMPCFYRGNTFLQEGTSVSLKLFDGHDWLWKDVKVRETDWRYVCRQMDGWAAAPPVLTKRGHRYELRVAYTLANKRFPKYKKDKEATTVLGVDLGINTDAVCSAVQKDGTVTGQRFIDSPVEKDRMDGLLNTIKKAQQQGNRKTPRLWRLVNNYNRAIAIKTAAAIVSYAQEMGADVIVFEYLKMRGKKHGAKGQRLSLWRKREIQRRVQEMAARKGIRVSYICAVNTSRLAYDGSGKMLRGKEAGFSTESLCRFSNGKVYNCDLSASKNIAARYHIRALLKSVPAKERLRVQAKVPELSRRTSCVLTTLIRLAAVLGTLKAV